MKWSMSKLSPVGKYLLGFIILVAHQMEKVETLMGFLHNVFLEHQITIIMNLSGLK